MARGRPCFEATASQRRKVEKLATTGMSRPEIAILIGCCRSTLDAHFGEELARGHARCRRDLLALMWTAARRGRVGAILWLEQRMSEDAERRVAPLGKKAQAEAAALTAGGEGSDWGDDLLQPQSEPKLLLRKSN